VVDGHPNRWTRTGLTIAAVSLLAAGSVTAAYPRQVRAYLTHWKGSPTHTVAYEAPDPGAGLVRVAVAGDVGDSGSRLEQTAAAMDALAGGAGFDALVLLGDNVYPDGDPAGLEDTVFGPFDPLLEHGTRLLAIVGNHDVHRRHGPAQMRALGMPGLWWSTRIGDVLFVGLDSNRPRSSRQQAWLIRTLSTTDATWKVVALHHPPYSAGYQGSDLDARSAFTPIFARYGVQLVLSGHDHDYQRSQRMKGVTYIVSGAAAGSRRTGDRDFTARSFAWHHFVELDVYPDHLVGRAINQSGRVADTWTLTP
jgi:3',5'-cyclic AMP phosphodiesterase CpdA